MLLLQQAALLRNPSLIQKLRNQLSFTNPFLATLGKKISHLPEALICPSISAELHADLQDMCKKCTWPWKYPLAGHVTSWGNFSESNNGFPKTWRNTEDDESTASGTALAPMDRERPSACAGREFRCLQTDTPSVGPGHMPFPL